MLIYWRVSSDDDDDGGGGGDDDDKNYTTPSSLSFDRSETTINQDQFAA